MEYSRSSMRVPSPHHDDETLSAEQQASLKAQVHNLLNKVSKLSGSTTAATKKTVDLGSPKGASSALGSHSNHSNSNADGRSAHSSPRAGPGRTPFHKDSLDALVISADSAAADCTSPLAPGTPSLKKSFTKILAAGRPSGSGAAASIGAGGVGAAGTGHVQAGSPGGLIAAFRSIMPKAAAASSNSSTSGAATTPTGCTISSTSSTSSYVTGDSPRLLAQVMTTPPPQQQMQAPQQQQQKLQPQQQRAPAGAAVLPAGRASRMLALCPQLPPSMQRSEWVMDDYTLLEKLYKGYASVVYKAVCKRSREVVVLKCYQLSAICELYQHQIFREVRLHSSLQHENVVVLYAAFQEGDRVVMVEEYADGGDLFALINKYGGRLSERVAVQMVLDPFLRVLQYMHTRGIIHRDIKPENILFSKGSMALKLADFGLAIDLRQERAVTRAGTLDYMAPEVLKCPFKSKPEENKEKLHLHYSNTADSWAVGVLTYELLVGCPPFYSEDRSNTEARIRSSTPVFPAYMSEAAREFVTAALRKTPGERPSVLEMVHHPWVELYRARRSMRQLPLLAADAGLGCEEEGGAGEGGGAPHAVPLTSRVPGSAAPAASIKAKTALKAALTSKALGQASLLHRIEEKLGGGGGSAASYAAGKDDLSVSVSAASSPCLGAAFGGLVLGGRAPPVLGGSRLQQLKGAPAAKVTFAEAPGAPRG